MLPDEEEPGLVVVLPELLPEPMLPLLELPVLPEPVVLPEPEVLPDALPYCLTQSSRCVPVRPTHWLGVADGLEVLLLEDGLELLSLLDPLPLLPPALGAVVDEPPVLPLLPLPELWAIDTLARPSRAAATAALRVFAITMYAPLV